MRTKSIFLVMLSAIFILTTCKKDETVQTEPEAEKINDYFGIAINQQFRGPGLTFLQVDSYQQTTEYTCGPASVISLLHYYGRNGDEMQIASEMGTSNTTGTTPDQMTDWLNGHGFLASWHENGNLDTLRNRLAKGKPTLVEWSDWGGHWVMAVGFDTRNNDHIMDDVIIFADPYDYHDDHRDGFTWFNAERFYYMWYDALLFGRLMKNVYITAEPQ